MTLLSIFRKTADTAELDAYLGHLRDRNRAMSEVIAAKARRNTQGIHHAQQRARAATCAALKIELKRRKFEYKPTAREMESV